MQVKHLLLISILFLGGCVTVEDGPSQQQKASKINVQLGIGYYHQNNLELADEKLRKALDQDPQSSQAHHAFAVLQNRFLNREKSEFHFRKAVELDGQNSEALNNFGAFLCQDERYEEAESMFVKAVDNPLYKTPEVAYTNAALCLRKGQLKPLTAKGYLLKALTIGRNYGPALLELAEIGLEENQTERTLHYVKRFHLASKPTARSVWLKLQAEYAEGNTKSVHELGAILQRDFPESKEYKLWLELK